MKIALIRQSYQLGGGAERSLGGLMAELVKQGHDLHLFASRWDRAQLDGVSLHRVPVLKGFSFLKVLSFAAFSSGMLRGENFDIVHSFERTLRQDIYRAGDGCHREWLLRRRQAIPWRRALDAVNPLHRSILFLESRLFAPGRCRRVIANSKMVKEEILRHYRTPAPAIAVVYNGVDLVRFRPSPREGLRRALRERLGLNSQELVLLFVGSGFERKGLKRLIEGAALVRGKAPGRDFRILVAGKGDPRPYLAFADRLGLEGRLRFLGVCAEVEELYAAADVFVLPTLYDPFANACLEAMAAGLPVVTTAHNGASELIEDGRSGLILKEPGDPGECAERLLGLSEEKRRSMGEEARRVAEAFPLRRNVEETLNVYREVQAEKSSQPAGA